MGQRLARSRARREGTRMIDASSIGVFYLVPDDDVGLFKEDLSERQLLAARIVKEQSDSRLDTSGGYPDRFAFIDNLIVIASLDHDGAPDLEIEDLEKFITENDFWLETCGGSA
jgi:hypothetical protein